MNSVGRLSAKEEHLIPQRQIWKAIAEDIKEAIISGRHKPGERLKEADLAAKYSVSKTPVREAIRYLEGIGFVEIIPHTSLRVTKMNKKDVQNHYRIQGVLEGLAVREALPNMTQKDYDEMEKCTILLEKHSLENDYAQYAKANNHFHSIIWAASDNERLVEMHQNTFEKIQRFHSVPRRFPGRFKGLAFDHREILEAVVQKNEERSEMLARRHVQKQEQYIVELLDREDSF